MCQAPITLPNGQLTACHRCPQCIDLAQHDWIGRNIAESKTSYKSHAVTLTYGRVANDPDHLRAVILTYSDVQKYLKILRRHYSVRYLITGEFGGLKGRTHWHGVFHWQDDRVPEVLIDTETTNQGHWDHGFSYWREASYAGVKYACKYVLKDQNDDERQGHLAMSKKPPLGAKYFARLAWQMVDQGVAPRSLDYDFPEVVYTRGERAGKRINFRLTGRSAEMFLDEYMRRWDEVHPGRDYPKTEVLWDLWQKRIDRLGGFWRPKRVVHESAMNHKTLWKISGIYDWQQEFERYWDGKQVERREGRERPKYNGGDGNAVPNRQREPGEDDD